MSLLCRFKGMRTGELFEMVQFGVYFHTILFSRADQFASIQNNPDKENQPKSHRSGGGSSFFKKKSARRAKSLGKDHWDEVIFCKYEICAQGWVGGRG